MSWQTILKFPAGEHLASVEDIERNILEILQNAGAVATQPNFNEVPYGKRVRFTDIKNALENVDDLGQYKSWNTDGSYEYENKTLGSDSRLHRILDNMSKAGKIHLERLGGYSRNQYFIPAEPDWKETLQEKQAQEQQMKEKKEEAFRLAQEKREQEKDAQRLQQITRPTTPSLPAFLRPQKVKQRKTGVGGRKLGTVRGGRK